jgi:AraC-like DNA-binding protein
MQQALSKFELKRVIQQFLKDPNRGISIRLFAELAGMSQGHLQDVFLYQTEPVSEIVQRRVDKAYKAFINGEVSVMQNKDGSRYIEYRKVARPLMKKTLGLIATHDGIKINLGIKPKYNYGQLNLDEQLKGG